MARKTKPPAGTSIDAFRHQEATRRTRGSHAELSAISSADTECARCRWGALTWLDQALSTRRNHELMSAISCAHTECSIGYSCHSTR